MYISKLKKLIIVSTSLVVVIVASVGGWAIVNNSNKSVIDILKNTKHTIPNLKDEKNYNYSLTNFLSFSNNSYFVFNDAQGYDKNIEYKVIEQIPTQNNLNLELKIQINLKDSAYKKYFYNVEMQKPFATPEESENFIITETINDLPLFKNNIGLNVKPTPETTILPSQITLPPSEFLSHPCVQQFEYLKNKAKVKVASIIDINSTESEFDSFKVEFDKLIGVDNFDINAITNMIKENNTLMIFSVFVKDSANSKGVLISKNFSNLDPSNHVENAKEFLLSVEGEVDSPFLPPTANQIIKSIEEENSLQYLNFNIGNEEQLFNKFNYIVSSVFINPGDIIQNSINVNVTIFDKEFILSKKYTVVVNGLLSIQQNELNILLGEKDQKVLLKPVISDAYKGKDLSEVVDNYKVAIEFIESDLELFKNYNYELISAELNLSSNGKYITTFIILTNKIDASVNHEYFSNLS